MIVKRDPIAALIAQAAQAPPPPPPPPRLKATKATKAAPVVVLLDTSGSMAETADGGLLRIEVLREALEWALQAVQAHPILIAFSSTPKKIALPGDLPYPSGGTALEKALAMAGANGPAKTIVISDGEPDDVDLALAAAAVISGSIDTIYCGPDDGVEAKAFLRALARIGKGSYTAAQGRPALGAAIRGLLAGSCK
jgi:hypothetical protein